MASYSQFGQIVYSGVSRARPGYISPWKESLSWTHYFNTDFAIMKNTKIPRWENAGFQFFNFFNHPNFGLPEVDMSGPEFGAIGYLDQPPTSVLGAGLGGDVSPRMIQLKVQLQF